MSDSSHLAISEPAECKQFEAFTGFIDFLRFVLEKHQTAIDEDKRGATFFLSRLA
jgi:hypothetical protein